MIPGKQSSFAVRRGEAFWNSTEAEWGTQLDAATWPARSLAAWVAARYDGAEVVEIDPALDPDRRASESLKL